jgi:predicted nucleic acid-binding protein
VIAASALEAGRKTLWSEDIQHGMKLNEDLRIACSPSAPVGRTERFA